MIIVAGCAPIDRAAMLSYDHGAAVRGDKTRAELALIFTGGDQGQATESILNILDKRRVPASFFLTGGYLAVDHQCAQVKRMIADGHYVGPHSDSHPLYCSWEDRSHSLVSQEIFSDDLQRNIDQLRKLGVFGRDVSETIYLIPPYEWFNQDQVEWARAMNVRLINFTSGSGSNRDWIPESDAGFVSSKQIVADVLEYERAKPAGLNGFLLLFHLGSTRTDLMDTELESLIIELCERGYRFVRVDQLLRDSCPPRCENQPTSLNCTSPEFPPVIIR